jgi:hypothetical protein
VRVVEQQGRVSVSWAPGRTGAAPTRYELRVRGTVTGDFSVGAIRSVEGALPPGPVSIGVVALNACGQSLPTAPIKIDVPESGASPQTATTTAAGEEN